MAQLAVVDVPRLKLKWAFGFPGAIIAFAPPTIVAVEDAKVFEH